MADVGVELFRHNLWANLRLIDACSSLGSDDLDATGLPCLCGRKLGHEG